MNAKIKYSFLTIFLLSVFLISGCGSTSTSKDTNSNVEKDTNSPSNPANLSAIATSNSQVDLKWGTSNDNIGVTGYEIYRGSEKIKTSTITEFIDTGLNPDTKYCYKVKAYDSAGNVSGDSNEACATPPSIADKEKPSAPGTLTATSAGTSQINLNWTGSSDNTGVVHYEIYRSSINAAKTPSTNYSDIALPSDTTYCYIIMAVDQAGNSSAGSNEACAKTSAIADNAKPTVPINIAGIKSNSKQINLNWTPSTDNVRVSGYAIFRGTEKIGTTNTTGFSDTDFNTEIDNCYTIKTYDASGNLSDSSEQICIKASGQASGTVGSSGGTIEINDPSSPINGAKVVVPQDALDSNETVKITISYDKQLPGPLDSGVISASNVIILSKDSQSKFKEPVTVTIPYTDAQMDAGDMPAVFYWDSTYNKYVSVGVKDIDTVNKTITFTTVHFSHYVALVLKGLAKSLNSVDSGFRPGTDGFYHPNFGSYDAPGGSSLGMANYSTWYFDNKKSVDGNGLYNKYREGDSSKWEDDVVARELISRSFIASSQQWAKIWLQKEYKLSQANTGLLLITAMQITKSPQIFLMTDQWPSPNTGHAAVVYKFDLSTGKFYINDSNFPGEEVTIDWNINSGFSNYSKNPAYSPQFTYFGFEAFSSSSEVKEFETLYSGAESGWTSSKYQIINITSPALDASNTATVSDPNNVTITGTVTGGIATAKYLVYNVNGTNGLSGQLVTLDASGNFSFTIPNLPLSSNSIILMSTDDAKDATRRVPSAYAGFKEITIKVLGQDFFTNLGFETGDYTGWTHETHTWSNTTPGSFTPEKSVIETVGLDPIDSTIQKVYKGSHSARINNSDNSYHISSASQSATVPNVANPQLRFSWTAVLEDPNHAPADQPYIDITVTDDTTNQALYYKHFYSDDPAYPGWHAVYGWKIIPWQIVNIDVKSAIGHQITIKVTAADCALGGHGGYAYIDADE